MFRIHEKYYHHIDDEYLFSSEVYLVLRGSIPNKLVTKEFIDKHFDKISSCSFTDNDYIDKKVVIYALEKIQNLNSSNRYLCPVCKRYLQKLKNLF